MSNSQLSKEPTLLTEKLFNASTHHYVLNLTSSGKIEFTSNDESEAFNEMQSPANCKFNDAEIKVLGCFGNQHPVAVIRDMAKVKKWDEQTLREYSMFTIGDFLIVTKDHIYFAVNGDLIIRSTEAGFTTTKGQA